MNLQSLDLEYNQLTGPIPGEIGSLANLQTLNLASNQLSGPIPAVLSSLSDLNTLYLSGNPSLVCWEKQSALDWALSLSGYIGPKQACLFSYSPIISLATGN